MSTNGWLSPLRSVSFEARFDSKVEALRGGDAPPARVDEVVDGMEWAAATAEDPSGCFAFVDLEDGTRVFLVETDAAYPNVPALTGYCVFSEDDESVRFVHLEETPNDDADDDI